MRVAKFSVPEIVFGAGCMSYVGSYALQLGAKKVFLVSDEGLEQAGWVEALQEILHAMSLNWIYDNDVTSNPRDYQVHRGAELYLREQADLIIALGGGSPLDLAKGIAAVASNGGTIQDYEGANLIVKPLPPMIFVPSTAGSGSDVSQFAIITNVARKVKMSLISRSLAPNVSLVDPRLVATVDDELLISSAIDALAHAIESYVSPIAHALTETLALRAIDLILRHLQPALAKREPHDLEQLSMAATAAGISFSNACLGAGHAIAHSLGGFFDVAHGLVHASLLPAVMRYNLPACTEKMAAIGHIILGRDHPDYTRTALEGIARLEAFFASLNTPYRLRHVVSDQHVFPQICAMATKDACLLTNPRPADADDLLGICREAW